MDALIEKLKELSINNFPNEKVYQLLENSQLPYNEIEDYVKFSDKKYTRHLVYKDDNFELLLMCWKSGQKAPIHGHEGEKCFMRVERGALQFTNYNLISTDPLTLTRIESLKGEVGFLDGPADVHSVENIYDEDSITFHIYAKPYNECDVYDIETGSIYRKDLVYDSMYKEPC
ncbi:MAG: cysteine dioxygenase family protein [Candidatus Neomarinimicrobiota bacterium]|mgnify:FL=1|nr:hypothetical protein [Candidatus Neomarinimicrobiota bacterium]MEC9436830.1 cysteine dioxygenase family protein [Candidatus Neomarinimicrobiota bacterium]|tara:strand:- start:2230 stop:2748 length:519 start_codon:yes stop_codon:yes gene_type:complete